ncbi:hypothetical protein VTO58DRAFT_110758 [Aureobasidium pullulans]
MVPILRTEVDAAVPAWFLGAPPYVILSMVTLYHQNHNHNLPTNMYSRTLHLFRATRIQRLQSPTSGPTPTLRLFSTSFPRSIKEDKNRSPEELEAEKQKQLKAQKEGKAQWNENLASAGEASITADKQEVKDHDSHMEELQKETAGKAEKEHPHGKKD